VLELARGAASDDAPRAVLSERGTVRETLVIRRTERRIRAGFLNVKRRIHPRWIGVRRWLIDLVWNEERQDLVVDCKSYPGIVIVKAPAEIEPYWGYVIHRRLGIIDHSSAGAMQHVRDPRQRHIYRGLPAISHMLHRSRRVQVTGMPLSLRNPWSGNYYHGTIECLGSLAMFSEAGLLEGNTVVIGSDLSETRLWNDFVMAGGLRSIEVAVQDDAWIAGSGRVAFPDYKVVSGVETADIAEFGIVEIDADFLVRTLRFLQRVLPVRIREPELQLFVLRGANSRRPLRNEAELAEHLTRRGFRSVDPGKLSWVEQVQLFRRASCVIGVHGAALTNIVYRFPESLRLLEIMGPSYRADHYRNIARELSYDYVAVTGATNLDADRQGSFGVDPEVIDHVLDGWQ
jgi:hypothetical protein